MAFEPLPGTRHDADACRHAGSPRSVQYLKRELAPENAVAFQSACAAFGMRSRVRPTMTSPCSMTAPTSAGTRSPSRRVPFRAEVPHADTAVLQQRQQRMLRRRMVVIHDNGATEVTANAAFGAGALEALPQDAVAMRVDLLDQHHGVHCRAPR